MGSDSTKPARRPSRAATEQALMDAALRLLKRDGVLAGLNMQEVADEAGVNRGLIHHYFGNRQALLRAAMDSAVRAEAERHEQGRGQAPAAKGLFYFNEFARNNTYLRLIALLALDGDEALQPIAFAPDLIADAERERAAGEWRTDLDAEAMITLWESTLLGYFLLRQAVSRQLGIDQDDLDRRVLTVMNQQADGLRAVPRTRQEPRTKPEDHSAETSS